MTLTEFLLARIEEDQVRATMRTWHDVECEAVPQPGAEYTYPCDCGVPERLLAECEAKRRIIEAAWDDHLQIEGEWGMCRSREQMIEADDYPEVVRLLALPYADHPEFQPAWRL